MAEQCLSAAEELQLGLSRAFYGVARVLRLTKLRDLLSAARLGPDATVYLLGHRYCCPPHATEAQQEEVGPLALSCEGQQAIHERSSPGGSSQHRRRRCRRGKPGGLPPAPILFAASLCAGPGAHAAALPLHSMDDISNRVHANRCGRRAAAQRCGLGLHAAQVRGEGFAAPPVLLCSAAAKPVALHSAVQRRSLCRMDGLLAASWRGCNGLLAAVPAQGAAFLGALFAQHC